MSTNFISKGEADDQYVKQSIEDRKTIVTVRNRYDREIELPLYHAKKMERRGEVTIIADSERIAAHAAAQKEKQIHKEKSAKATAKAKETTQKKK